MTSALVLSTVLTTLLWSGSVGATPDPLLTEATREFTVEHRYLNLPVKNGAAKRMLTCTVAGSAARQFEIELADEDPDFWSFLDLGPFQGQRLELKLDKSPKDSPALQRVNQSDEFHDTGNLYREALRPQFHFSSRRGWNNDPNGLVYYRGDYHLFYQHNPYGWNWGNMHWGHAVSPDLIHWQELGDALYPDDLGTMFSGSAVVDWHNTAGFGQGGDKAIVCVYTAAGSTSPASQGRRFSQCLAYSTDRGRTWTKYEKNPVLPHIAAENRDPKVIWYEPASKWIMALYLDKSNYALFSSPDLKHWDRLCEVSLPGTSECPEFFEIPVDGERPNTRWIFYGGNGRYLVGKFDGKSFTPESGPHSFNFGNCFYASQTFNDIPASDGRRIQVAWGQVNLPGMPFNQMMDFPVELSLHHTDDGLRLRANPVSELKRLHQREDQFKFQPLNPDDQPISSVTAELMDITAEFEIGPASEVGLTIRGAPVTYDAKTQELTCLGKKGPLPPLNGQIRLRLLVDRASLEIFGNDGRLFMPMGIALDRAKQPLGIFSHGGQTPSASLVVCPLNSTWTRP